MAKITDKTKIIQLSNGHYLQGFSFVKNTYKETHTRLIEQAIKVSPERAIILVAGLTQYKSAKIIDAPSNRKGK